MKTEENIHELIENSFYSNNLKLYHLSNKQLLKLIKYFNIQSKSKNKYSLIKKLMPIRKKYQRIRELENMDYNEECPVCYMKVEMDNYIITNCCHIFCKKCMIQHILIGNHDFCPYCRDKCLLEDILVLPIDDNLLDELGILKITPDIINTGLFILDNIRFQQYIIDSNIIQFIREYQHRQLYISKFILIIKLWFILLGIYMLSKI
jgi:hypothetical protein